MAGPVAEPYLGVTQSITGRFWRERPRDDRAALALAQRLHLPEIVGRVLAARGVGPEDGERYLNPTLRELLPNPSDFRDMNVAAERLASAVTAGEKVAVFGDYDVDGATSSAALKRFFDAVGADLTIYIPDRLIEGYGPNAAALKRLGDQGAKVIVTVDCGTTAFDPLAQAKAAGLDVIVVDHHQAERSCPRPMRLSIPTALTKLVTAGNWPQSASLIY